MKKIIFVIEVFLLGALYWLWPLAVVLIMGCFDVPKLYLVFLFFVLYIADFAFANEISK